ncbi:hypothetical protein CSW12_29375 (plasmid) [Bacillus cereus]|nr:hypothetical protein CSW12_29375 [Bacillus cereus]
MLDNERGEAVFEHLEREAMLRCWGGVERRRRATEPPSAAQQSERSEPKANEEGENAEFDV